MAKGVDLTTGSIPKHLIKFGLPLLLGNLLQCLYNTVDVIVLDRFVGGAGITAASISGQIMLVVTVLSTGFSTGGTVVISQYFGRKDEDGLKRGMTTLFILFLGIAAVTTALTLAFGAPLLKLLNTPESALQQADAYLTVCACGIVTIFGYNAVCAVLRGIGDSKKPLYIVGFASLMNVVLDILFVGYFHMGAGGAAFATVLSQGASFVIAMKELFFGKRSSLRLRRSDWKFSKEELKHILRVGLPSACQSFSVRISMVIVLAMVNLQGDIAAAAFGVGVKIDNFAQLPRQAVAAAMTAMVGQNKGAGNNDRIRSVIRIGGAMNFGLAVVILVLLQSFSRTVAGLITTDTLIIDEVVRYIRIASFGYLPLSLMTSYNSLPIGIGFSEYALLNSFLDSVVARISLCWLFGVAMEMGMNGYYLGLALCPIVAMLSGCIYYRRGKWKDRQLIKKK